MSVRSVEHPLASIGAHSGTTITDPVLGLHANWRQFWLLVIVNAFVGAMVGLERTVRDYLQVLAI